jgi:hypothetical protein
VLLPLKSATPNPSSRGRLQPGIHSITAAGLMLIIKPQITIMKKKLQKLQLRKSTISVLSERTIQLLKGGAPFTALYTQAMDCPEPISETQRMGCNAIVNLQQTMICQPWDWSDAQSCWQSCFMTQMNCATSFMVICP